MQNDASKTKYLAKNTLIFAIGNFSTKLIAFVLVPFYTYVLTTEEYGVINLIFTICSVISPLLMLNLQDAVRRFALEKNANYNAILSTEWTVVIGGHLVGLILIPIMQNIPGLSEYRIILYLYLSSLTTNIIFLEYLRGRERMKSYAVCSFIGSAGVAVLNLLFLLKLRLGINGYFLSYIVSYSVSSFVAIIAGRQWEVFKNWSLDKKLFKEMVLFSLPMIPNSIFWWISSSSDHIMVIYLLGSAANGLYTVSYKIPTLISTISNICMQAWQISAIKESENGDSLDFSNKMFDAYIRLTFVLTAGLLLIIKPFMRIYVSKEYFNAWMYAPVLIVGFAFSTLATFVGTPYFVKKDMKGNMFSAASGAILNIILNFILIPLMGLQGAAVATCLSYVCIFIYRLIDTRKYLPLDYKNGIYIIYLVVIVVMLLAIFIENPVHYLLLLIGFVFSCASNYKLIKPIIVHFSHRHR